MWRSDCWRRPIFSAALACVVLLGLAAAAGAETLSPTAWGKGIDFSDPLDGVADETTVSTSTIDLELNAVSDEGSLTVQEDRAVFEFDLLSSAPCGVTSATLRLPISTWEYNTGDSVRIYAYGANGSLDLGDFAQTGTLVATPTVPGMWLAVDVTAAVNALIAAGDYEVGFLVTLIDENQMLSIWNVGDQHAQDFGDPELVVMTTPGILPVAWGKGIDFSDPLDGVADQAIVSTSTIDLELNAVAGEENQTVQEDRAIFEFDLATAAPCGVGTATLRLPISTYDVNDGEAVDLLVYTADGTLAIGDFAQSATLVSSPVVDGPWMCVDVTAAVESVFAGGSKKVGFRVEMKVENQLLSIWNVGDQGANDFGDPNLVITPPPMLLPVAWGEGDDDSDPLDGIADLVLVSTSTIDLELNAVETEGEGSVQESRGIFEFDFKLEAPAGVNSATLCLPIFPQDPPLGNVEVYAYDADGVLAIPDFQETGTLVDTVAVTRPWLCVDVTSEVNNLIYAGVKKVGFLIVLTAEDQLISIWNVGDQGANDFGDPHLCFDALVPATLARGTLRVNFARQLRDSLRFNGTFPTADPSGAASGMAGKLTIGGYVKTFTMGAGGRSAPDAVISVTIGDSQGGFRVTIRGEDLASALPVANVNVPSPGTTLTFPWKLELSNGWAIGGVMKFKWQARANRRGVGRIIP